jgi:hypothetical protein
MLYFLLFAFLYTSYSLVPKYIEKKIKIYDYYNNYFTIYLEKIKEFDFTNENNEITSFIYPIISSKILYKNKHFLNPIYQTKYKKLIENELNYRHKKWENVKEIEKIVKIIE